MKAVKSIQEAFQLRSTVAVLGFSVRTLSEMIKDEKLIESITEYAKNNKNSSPNRQSQNTYEAVIACKSTTHKNVSYCSCSATQLLIAPSQFPICKSPVG